MAATNPVTGAKTFYYVSARIHGPESFEPSTPFPIKLKLPKGCVGMMLVFDSVEAAEAADPGSQIVVSVAGTLTAC